MSQNEQNDLVKTMSKVVDQKVMPELQDIKEKLKEHDGKFRNIEGKVDTTMEMCAKNTEEVTLLRDDFTDMGYTVERIETKLDATIRHQDDASVKNSQLARRVLKLETKKAT